MINRLLRWSYHLLFFVTPLIVLPFTSELFEFNKMMVIYVLATIIGSLWLIKIILDKKVTISRNPIHIGIILFLISQFLSTLFSIDRHTSLFGYYGRFNGGVISLIAYTIIYFAYVSSFNRLFVLKLFRTSFFTSIIVILWGLPGKIGHDLTCYLFAGQFNNSCWTNQFHPNERMFSTLGQPNWLGAYLAVNFFIGLYFFVRTLINKLQINKSDKSMSQWNNVTMKQLFYGFYLVLNFVFILFTRSRSALGAVVFGGIVWAALYCILYRRQLKSYLKPFLILLFGLIVSVFIFKTGIDKIDTYLQITNNPLRSRSLLRKASEASKYQITGSGVTDSLDIRKIVWQGAIALGLRYPLFGTGVETFAYAYYFVRPQAHNLTSEWDYLYNKAHNEYLNYFATTGFIGLGAYLIMIGIVTLTFILYLKQSNNETVEQLLLISLLVSYLTILITNFVGFSTSTINLFFYLIPAFLLVSDKENHTIQDKPDQKSHKSIKQQVLVAGIFAATIYIVVQLGFYFIADVKYNLADNYVQKNDYGSAGVEMDQAVRLHFEHVYEDKFSNILANIAFIEAYQKQPQNAIKYLKASQYYNLTSLQASPVNVLYWKTRSKNDYLYYQTTSNPKYIKEGLAALITGQKLSPTDPKIYYSQSIYYSLLVDETKNTGEKQKYENLSLAAIDESIKMKPDLVDGYYVKAQLLIKFKRVPEAKAVYEYILKSINSQDAEAIKQLQSL